MWVWIILSCRIFILEFMPVKWKPTANCLSMTSWNTKTAFLVSVSNEMQWIKKDTWAVSISFMTAEEGKADFWRVHTRAQPKRQRRHCFQLGRAYIGRKHGRGGGAESKFFGTAGCWNLLCIYSGCESCENFTLKYKYKELSFTSSKNNFWERKAFCNS